VRRQYIIVQNQFGTQDIPRLAHRITALLQFEQKSTKMASNPVVLDGLLHLLAVVAILSAVGGSPAYNVALALYGILGLYSRIPRALLSLLILVGVSVVADIVVLSVYHDLDFDTATLSYGSVMTIIMLLLKVQSVCC